MKPALLLLFAATFCNCVLGQLSFDGPQLLWDEPAFDKQKIQRLNIKQVDIEAFELPITRGDDDRQKQLHYFNKKGYLTKLVELVQKDTQLIHLFHYNKHGVLGWKQTKDKRWNRSYREGYRFNGAKDVYQVKAYEMLRNDERMLLDTRQYVYNSDSLLIAIKSLENRRVVSVHKFDYDSKKRVKTEIFEDGNEQVLQTVSYNYDSQGRVSRVQLDKGVISEYRYDYNPQGQPLQIEWLENGRTKGLVIYQYENNGLVAQMDRILNPDTQQENHFVRVYNYQSR